MIPTLTLPSCIKHNTTFGALRKGFREDTRELQEFRELKHLEDLTCACCGIKMNPEIKLKRHIRAIANKTGEELINTLSTTMKYMNPAAKTVAKKVILNAQQNPALDIKEILMNMAEKRKITFLERQNKILQKQLKKYMKDEILYSLPKEISTLISHSYMLATEKINNHSKNSEYKTLGILRDTLLKKLQYGLKNYPDKKELISAIRDDIKKLDSYYNSSDAFILRSKLLEKKDIAELFFIAQSPSIEHIIPRSQGGTNFHKNLLIFCNQCNEERDYSSYENFSHSLVANIKKYLDIINSYIQKGELRRFKNYPREVAKTLLEVSNGSIDIKV